MKIRIVFFSIFNLLILSCKSNKNFEQEDIVQMKPFSKANYYKYAYVKNEPYFEGNVKIDSFKPIIYTNVKPLEINKNIPQKIYALSKNSWKSSKEYFHNDLQGMSVVYLEKNNKILFRNYYKSYTGKDFYKQDINKPRNKEDLVKYLKNKNAKYKFFSIKKSEKADVINADINGHFYRIIVDSTFCKSYLYYNKKDTINKFYLITDDAFWEGF